MWATVNTRRLWVVNPDVAQLRLSSWSRGTQGRAGVVCLTVVGLLAVVYVFDAPYVEVRHLFSFIAFE